MKKKRVKNRKLMDSYHDKPCLICARKPSDPCHIKTRGSGGDDTEENLLNMCRNCHIESHQLGWYRFIQKYPHMEKILSYMGWEIEDEFGVKKLRWKK